MWIQKRDFEGGQKRWKKKLQGLRDRWISAGWLKCRATRTDKLRSRWCIIDWHHLRVRTDTASLLRCSIQIDKCSIMFWKGRMCLIIGWNEGYMWPVSRAEGKGKTVTPIHKLQNWMHCKHIKVMLKPLILQLTQCFIFLHLTIRALVFFFLSSSKSFFFASITNTAETFWENTVWHRLIIGLC